MEADRNSPSERTFDEQDPSSNPPVKEVTPSTKLCDYKQEVIEELDIVQEGLEIGCLFTEVISMNHLSRLLYQVACQDIEDGCTSQSSTKFSPVFKYFILERIGHLISGWETAAMHADPEQIVAFHGLNIPECLQKMLKYICEIALVLADITDLNEDLNPYRPLLMDVYIGAKLVSNDLVYLLGSADSFDLPGPNECHWVVQFNGETDDEYLYLNDVVNLPGPPIFINRNISDKCPTLPSSFTAAIESSTDKICQICREDLIEAESVCVPDVCRHVCCSPCLKEWFTTTMIASMADPWSCPTCRQTLFFMGCLGRADQNEILLWLPTGNVMVAVATPTGLFFRRLQRWVGAVDDTEVTEI